MRLGGIGRVRRALNHRPFVTFSRLRREMADAYRVGGTARARCRLGADALVFRMRRRNLGFRRPHDRPRFVRLRNGLAVHYRSNTGDIQSIKEIWCEEIYRTPLRGTVRVAVDLGANIGMTSLWFHETFTPEVIVAVEPSRRNAELARRNFQENDVAVHFIEAAVGSRDGTATFSESESSNLGALSETGAAVQVVSMETVLRQLPEGAVIDLMKVDIEGGEADLFSGDALWLDSVRTMLVEFHPPAVDVDVLIDFLKARNFDYLPCTTLFPESVDLFFREGDVALGNLVQLVQRGSRSTAVLDLSATDDRQLPDI